MTELGDDWEIDADGFHYRKAARVLVIDNQGNLLLLAGHDGHDPDHKWWFTVGGGRDPGESARAAAVRELREETGFVVSERDLVGPVAERHAAFDFMNVTAHQDELFFLVYLPADRPDVSRDNNTALELSLVDGHRWFSAEELRKLAEVEKVWPEALPQMLHRWRDTWDGDVLQIDERSNTE